METPADKEQDLKKVKYINKATFPNLSTPLIKAALNGHVSCVRVLILAGADKDLQNADKKTAMDVVLAQIENLKKNLKQKDGNESQTQYSAQVEEDMFEFSNISTGTFGMEHSDLRERYEKCKLALEMSPEEIRMEDSAEVMGFDASRKDSHLQTFEYQALNLKQELERLVENSKESWCENKTKQEKDKIIDLVVKQFKDVMDKHRSKNAKWYNDGGKYRSAVSEMLSMKENAMAVPKLSIAMFKEWELKQNFLRQANRMVIRESLRALREKPEGSEERRSTALELCKSAGIVTELLEERNEMSETPLIREVGFEPIRKCSCNDFMMICLAGCRWKRSNVALAAGSWGGRDGKARPQNRVFSYESSSLFRACSLPSTSAGLQGGCEHYGRLWRHTPRGCSAQWRRRVREGAGGSRGKCKSANCKRKYAVDESSAKWTLEMCSNADSG